MKITAAKFLIVQNGKEKRASRQSHTIAWQEAKLASWDSPTTVIRVNADGSRVEVAAFRDGIPLFAKTEAAS